ncbi:hypothetical protein [Streptomyces sp. 8K308]|nr:hypothetical protein [Streptomyces sp. 8K308]
MPRDGIDALLEAVKHNTEAAPDGSVAVDQARRGSGSWRRGSAPSGSVWH